jgi:ABC-type uncharacterized transport system auxiliary subunit
LAQATLLALTLGLGGCFGAGFHSNQPLQQQFLLSWPLAGGTETAAGAANSPAGTLAAGRALEVLLPAAAPGLTGDGIAVLRPGEQLDYYNGARWAAAAPLMLQTLAVEALRQQGRFSLVESDSAPFAADWVLQLELTHFESDDAGSGGPPTVRVGLMATLGQRNARRALMTLTIDTHADAQADRMGAVVAAFQSATHAALQQLAERLAPVTPGSVGAAGVTRFGQRAGSQSSLVARRR